MDETEHMPRYTLTLVDSTGAMEPLILMDDDLKSIAAKLEGRVSAKTRGRLPRGTGGISATPKGYRAYSTVTDPLTGKDHRVSGFGRTRSQAEARLKEKLAEFDRTHRVGYVRPPTVAEWMDHWLTDVCKPRLKPRTWGTYASVIANNIVPSIGAVVYGQINVYGVTTKSERHKRSYWTRTADGNGIGGRKAPVPYGS